MFKITLERFFQYQPLLKGRWAAAFGDLLSNFDQRKEPGGWLCRSHFQGITTTVIKANFWGWEFSTHKWVRTWNLGPMIWFSKDLGHLIWLSYGTFSSFIFKTCLVLCPFVASILVLVSYTERHHFGSVYGSKLYCVSVGQTVHPHAYHWVLRERESQLSSWIKIGHDHFTLS